MMQRNEGGGRVVVVTGGASGIGLATAEVLRERGWRVVIADIDAARGREAGQRLGCDDVAFDVSDEAATEAAFSKIETRVGPIYGLFANAGLIQPGGRPEDLPIGDFDRIVAVNIRGVYMSCLAACTRMAARRSGAVVITGSVVARRTAPLHAYAMAKAAVVHLAACFAGEWGRSGIRVNSVSPGYVATPPLQAAIDSGRRDPRLLTESSALGRLVEAGEIGKGVAFLLSDDASAITGIDLPIDAGWTASANLATYGGPRPPR